MTTTTALDNSIDALRKKFIEQYGVGAVKFGDHAGTFFLDLSSARGFRHFWTKKEAVTYARAIGWSAKDAKRYRTRFSQGWALGFQVDGERYRLATESNLTDAEYKDYNLSL